MINRVTIIGSTGSGKTTYMTGMYAFMSGSGCKGFNLVTDPNSDLRLSQMWEALESGRFPLASFDAESYTFHISHCWKPVCDFTWLDYPGGLLMDPQNDQYATMTESIEKSDCLLFVIDSGMIFALDAQDAEDYRIQLEKKIRMNSSIRSEIMQLTALARKGVRIPPICITLTKADLIDPAYVSVIEEVLREQFETLFMGCPRVIITAVSLGRDIETCGADPHCVEEPIVYAVLNILLKYIEELNVRRKQKAGIVNKKRSFLDALTSHSEIEEAKRSLEEIEKIGQSWISDAEKLLGLIPEKKIVYVGGRRRSFREYYKQLFFDATH